jgi:hemoglobin/transferrin/lactoferrin receptor protein
MMNNLNIAHTKTTLFFDKMTLQLAQQYFEESRISRDINKNNRERRTEQVNAYSINLDFSKEIGQRNNLSYGIEYILNHINSTGINENIETGLSEIGPSRYPQSDWTSYAAYVTNSYQLSEKAHLKAGARYSQYILNAIFDTTFYAFPFTEANIDHGALTGSIGIVYQPTASWIMSTNLSTAFRSPNVDDLGKVFDSEPGSVVVPNPNLEAEYAYNADVSITKVISKTIKIDFTAYYTLLNNALVRRDYLLNGMDSILYDGEMSKVQAIQNAAQANVFGVQAGFEIKLPSGFGLSSDFNYQKGIEELDDGSTSPSRHAPPFYGNTALTYSANKLSLHVYAIYSGEKSYEDMPESEKSKDYMYATDENGNPYSPAWYTVNFKAMYQFAEHFSLSAGIENITDQRYRPYSSGIVAPGRNFVLSLRANF